MLTPTLNRRAQSFAVAIAFRALLIVAGACSKDSTAPPPASTISVTSGAAQTGVVNSALALPVVVTVIDAAGQPVAGIGVSFSPVSGSGSVSSAQTVTDGNGNTQVSWTLGTAAGTDSLMVTAGTLAPIAVLATATAAPASSLGIPVRATAR